MASLLNMSGGSLLKKGLPPYLKEYTLIHHWEADDWTVGTDWVDRVGGLVFQRVGNPIKENGLIAVCSNKGYFQLNANSAAPNGINMGSLWVVEVEGVIEKYILDSNQLQVMVDFGSVALANHSFAIFTTPTNKLEYNPKFTGNNNGGLYYNSFDFTPYYGKIITTAVGTKEIDANTVLPFYMLETKIKHSPNTLTKKEALFNRNFSSNTVLVGRAVNSNYSHDNLDDYKYIKSIKIYTKY